MSKLLLTLMSVLLLSGIAVFAGEIHDACQNGDLARVKEIVKENPEIIKVAGEREYTPLHAAAYFGQSQIVEYLIRQGVDLNAKKENGSTASHGAAFYGHPEALKMLLKHGAEIDAKNDADYTPLLSAFAGGQSETSQLLIEAGADLNVRDSQQATPLMLACTAGLKDLYDLLISKGALVDVREIDNETPMHYAAYGGNLEIIKDLQSRGLELNEKTEIGTTPLQYACMQGKLDVAKYLIENGADVNAQKNDGWGPILFASHGDHVDIVKLLLENKADPNLMPENGTPALYWAAARGNVELVDLLIENGSDVDIRSGSYRTALHGAMYHGSIDAVKALINRGADINAKEENGRTPLMLAVLEGNLEMVDFLISNGAQQNIKENHKGRTALHLASIKGYTDIVETLIDNGAEFAMEDNARKTPVYMACRYGNSGAAKVLKKNGASFKGIECNFGKSELLSNNLKEGQANLWYLGHCGYAVQTKNHLMVFDYWTRGKAPDNPCLSNGRIYPQEIADLNVDVFVTHQHQDHYDTTIFTWDQEIKDINYIFGFQPEALPQAQQAGYNGEHYEYIGPHQQKSIDGMEIVTLKANDAGVGFLVNVDGITIYHAGDHAGWRNDEREGYTTEIDYISQYADRVDFAFLNVTGCHVRDRDALTEAIFYTLDKMDAELFFPTHGLDREYIYKEFADNIAKEGYNTVTVCPECRGDRFFYKGRKIKEL